ncbi:DNA-invertase hin [Aliiroseovarius pelagivivens]|uniref:DNA-invertase hin n=1 Tax=Aliiroseovarius pelagivivens TaxID=1639690 RepID=A0A2R8ATI9_9RHOB|nr:recombinase family protein [Aliiroseovarius pelagivivens]SPF79169.1 DNA-invertase hin [Aliiroseovarius pelagivivens]
MTGTIVGYARVSTAKQNEKTQVHSLEQNGATRLFIDKASGKSRDKRPELERALDWVRDGDVLMVTRLDRLARSVLDLHEIAKELERKEVGLRVIEQSIDTTTPQGRLMFTMLGAIAEFETALRAERQEEGIALAKAEGRFNGRPVEIDHEAVKKAQEEGKKPTQIAEELGIARSSVYRVLAKIKESEASQP